MARRPPPWSVVIESNIGGGKSTCLGLLQKNSDFQCHYEPVHKWENMPCSNGQQINLLHDFYSNPNLYAFELQEWARLTFLQDLLASGPPKGAGTVLAHIRERCVFSCEVFVAAGQFLTPAQETIVTGWQELLWDANGLGSYKLRPDVVIYLQVSPDTCLARVRNRNRTGEESITRQYLGRLENEYQRWLKRLKTQGVRVVHVAAEGPPQEVARRVEKCIRSLAFTYRPSSRPSLPTLCQGASSHQKD
jgi:deoxyadenosine/deoxycytidine kinase